jgi:hypothetical protein
MTPKTAQKTALAVKEQPVPPCDNLETGFEMTWGRDERYKDIVPMAKEIETGKLFPLNFPEGGFQFVLEIKRVCCMSGKRMRYNRITGDYQVSFIET